MYNNRNTIGYLSWFWAFSVHYTVEYKGDNKSIDRQLKTLCTVLNHEVLGSFRVITQANNLAQGLKGPLLGQNNFTHGRISPLQLISFFSYPVNWYGVVIIETSHSWLKQML